MLKPTETNIIGATITYTAT